MAKKVRELKIIFDTNALYTGSASDLVKNEVKEIIQNTQFPDLKVSWYIPYVVRHERQYQMIKRAQELLPSVGKLERLLGHNLAINEEILKSRVENVLDKQVKDLGLNLLSINYDIIKWNDVIFNSLYRIPPFEEGKTEKGFRDAILIEECAQLVVSCPSTPTLCRIAIVSDDGLLKTALNNKFTVNKNVHILSDLEELKGVINTFASQADETFIRQIRDKANKYYFENDNKNTLYYKKTIRDVINKKFRDKLEEVPRGASGRENVRWYIHEPNFIKKEGQRITWSSRISVEAIAYTYSSETPDKFGLLGALIEAQIKHKPILGTYTPASSGTYTPASGIMSTFATSPVFPPISASGIIPSPPDNQTETLGLNWPSFSASSERKILMKGNTQFEVIWSIAITKQTRLTKPIIEDLKYIQTEWV